MNAKLLLRDRLILTETLFVEMVVWSVPTPVPGSSHGFKYRLALVSKGECVMRYDNERGKGDHKHLWTSEVPYRFVDVDTLLADFWTDVNTWKEILK